MAGWFAGGALACALLAAAVAPAAAQTLSTGVISGTVVDDRGDPLNDVFVALTNRGTGSSTILRTGRAGRFTTSFLAPGTYDVLFERLGFQPERLAGVVVAPGERVEVAFTLHEAGATVDSAVVRQAAATASTLPQRWSTSRSGGLPLETGDISELAKLSSRAGPDLVIEGLPAHMHALVVDGMPLMDRPGGLSRRAAYTGISLSSLGYAELMPFALDSEWPGTPGAYFTGLTRTGTRELGAYLFGDGSSDALGGAADAAPYQSFRVGGQVGGSLAADTGQFIIGAEYQRSETPLESLWTADPLTDPLANAVSGNGGLAPFTEPTTSRFDRIGAFGRADFRVAEDHALSTRARFSTFPEIAAVSARTGEPLGFGATPEGREASATATLTSALDAGSFNEATVGYETSRLTRVAAAGDVPPLTDVVSLGRRLGADELHADESDLQQIYARETLIYQTGAHRLKLGGWLAFRKHDLSFTEDRAGRFTFATTEDLLSRTGAFRIVEGTLRRAQFDLLTYTLFVHDAWIPSPGLELQGGVRLSTVNFPDTVDVGLNNAWLAASGIRNNSLPKQKRHLEPRFGLRWIPAGGGWTIQAAATVDGEGVWPEVLAELFGNNGGQTVRAAVGTLGSWPGAPSQTVAPAIGPTLTVLGPEFTGPLSTRFTAGITRAIGAFTVGVAGTYRKTDYLPERRDINLLPTPASADQHGRPVFGALRKIGGLLVAEPGENRRLPGFSRVSVIEATGSSDYTGVTFSLDRGLAGNVALHGSYTYSRTEDDWLWAEGLDAEAQLSPFPDAQDGVEWTEGRSDFDTPHRLVLGGEASLPVALQPRIAALFRFQSGAPFTPGFRPGVDANADGSGRNDPAFIDESIPGTSDLVSQWSCLRSQVGTFAERNSCRADDVRTLDVRLTLDVLRTDRYFAQIVLDGLDLIGSETGLIDRAVYLVDPAADLQVSGDGSTVTVPLIANPNFGELLTRFAPQRQFRLGLRVSY